LTSLFEVPVEAVKKFWDSRPCNIRHSPSEVGTLQYFQEVEARKYFVEPHIPGFAEFDKWRGKRVLEIGCGIGTDTISFAKAGARVTAVDLSEQSLALAKKRAALYGLDVKFYCADAEQLSSVVPVEKYDLVYSFGVIHHTPHPDRVVQQIKNYVGPGSTVKIMVYNRYSWKVFWILVANGRGAFWNLSKLVAKYSEAKEGCPVTYAYSPGQARRLLAGFDILGARVDHIFPYKISDYVQYRYRKVWYFRWMPGWLFHWFERRFGWHLCVTARVPD